MRKKKLRLEVIKIVMLHGSTQAKDNPFDICDKMVNYISRGTKDKHTPFFKRLFHKG